MERDYIRTSGPYKTLGINLKISKDYKDISVNTKNKKRWFVIIIERREVSKKGKRNYERKRKMLPEKINPLVRTNCGVHFFPLSSTNNLSFLSIPRIFIITRSYPRVFLISLYISAWRTRDPTRDDVWFLTRMLEPTIITFWCFI